MKNIILIFLFQLLFIFSSKAQELKIGFDIMPGRSIQYTNWDYYFGNCTHCDPIYLEAKPKWSNSMRFTLEYRIKNSISIETGLGFMNRGLKLISKNSFYYQNINYYYLTAPILFNYHLKNFYLGVGAAANIFLRSKKHNPNFHGDISFEKDLPKQHNQNTLSLISQIGYHFQIHKKFSLNCGLYYDHLFAGERVSYMNYGLNLGVRYQINKGKEK